MSETIAIIDYGSGNLRSAGKAFEKAARDGGVDATILVTPDPARVAAADRIVLPGVGAFADCRRGLDAVAGMTDALVEAVIKKGRPFLGICVGMQLMADEGLEHGRTPGLGWIPGRVTALEPADASLKIPHMGWNTLGIARPHPLFDGVDEGAYVYFVHSYHLAATNKGDVAATTDYGGPVTAMVARDNLVGTQFHPEKSQRTGLRLIHNFINWKP